MVGHDAADSRPFECPNETDLKAVKHLRVNLVSHTAYLGWLVRFWQVQVLEMVPLRSFPDALGPSGTRIYRLNSPLIRVKTLIINAKKISCYSFAILFKALPQSTNLTIENWDYAVALWETLVLHCDQ